MLSSRSVNFAVAVSFCLALCQSASAGQSTRTVAASDSQMRTMSVETRLSRFPSGFPAMSGRFLLSDDQCIAHNGTCVLNGTPCCGSDQRLGKFPNTTCQTPSTNGAQNLMTVVQRASVRETSPLL